MDGVTREIFDDSIGGFIIDNMKTKISINMIENLINIQGPYLSIKKSSIETIAKKYNEIYNDLLSKN